ncbi:hypothetical protein AAG570_005218 [Ranatra chinensis]|uniref:Uncharacterized protein n=1 Tax=Ranatra chinensis TaxID=642074 RepID=A0ABD0XZU9_9HEMI
MASTRRKMFNKNKYVQFATLLGLSQLMYLAVYFRYVIYNGLSSPAYRVPQTSLIEGEGTKLGSSLRGKYCRIFMVRLGGQRRSRRRNKRSAESRMRLAEEDKS